MKKNSTLSYVRGRFAFGEPSAWLRTGINYDIKYRMSKALFGEDETESEDE